ncbi:MAG TPA: alpha-L-fucosidase [Puia sp.]|nr:alpha-L-fucosidase [Puia sp.]
MSISRRNLIKNGVLGGAAMALRPGMDALPGVRGAGYGVRLGVAQGPFEGTRISLRGYEIPEWFRDAKFGIWAHWGPQSAVEAGDWYARNMYIEGSAQHAYHLKTYGHPSKFGFKDTIPAWKAEKFDPDHLMDIYKKAGAKYFMTMGVHHDNFDLWNSKFNRWNAVKMGPKKDIVGMWRQAARIHGLKFAVSDHLWISYKWFSSSKGSDKSGTLAGVSYDGADPRNFEYYGRCEEVLSNDGDLDWNENTIPESWKRHWFDRIKDLVDQYEPDLLYCDGQVPFEDYGLNLLAHLYNKNAAMNGGKTQAVYTSKRALDSVKGKAICVFDVERGVVEDIWPLAWQTDTCIGDWHYNRRTVGHYKTPKTIVDMLVDIVSKNGNLMLNIPLPASGMPDPDELAVLDGITKWMAVNSEGIYGTRPWKRFGEGAPQAAAPAAANEDGQSFNEGKKKALTDTDVRFTTKGGVLYAYFMGWPSTGIVKIRALAGTNVEGVELFGRGQAAFAMEADGLKVVLAGDKPCEHAYGLKITGRGIV